MQQIDAVLFELSRRALQRMKKRITTVQVLLSHAGSWIAQINKPENQLLLSDNGFFLGVHSWRG